MRKIPKETLLLTGLVIAAVALTFMMTDYEKKADNARLVADFNARMSDQLRIDNADEIRSVLPGCSMYLTAADYAYLHNFKDRYDIDALPVPPDDYHKTGDFVRNLMAQLAEIQDYQKERGVSDKAVSDSLNRQFATGSGNYVAAMKIDLENAA